MNTHNSRTFDSIKNDDNTGDAAGKAVCPLPSALNKLMRVVLITEDGMIYTIILPNTMEGRYKFIGIDKKDNYPFFICAYHGKWVINIGEESSFVNSHNNSDDVYDPKHCAVIDHMMLTRFHYRNRVFVIYAENTSTGDNTFLPYYFEERTDYSIGRLDSNQICYQNSTVSRLHALLHWNGQGWSIRNHGLNGTYVNNLRVEQAELFVGDTVFIMGLHIIIGPGYLLMNNANGRVKFNTSKIRHIVDEKDITFAQLPQALSFDQYYDRQPRKLVTIDPDPIEFEMPPSSLSAGKIPLLLRLGSPMLMGGRALMTGNYFMALTSMVMPALMQGVTEKDRKEYETRRLERYRAYLEYKKTELQNEKESEEQQLNYNYPDLNRALQFAVDKNRLWERRKSDEDFLSVRIGCGQVPLIAEKQYQKKGFEMEPDVLVEEMYAIAEKEVLLDGAPVMLSLTKDYIIGVTGSQCRAKDFFRNLIFQLALTHSYDEVKLVVLADGEMAANLNFVRYLPHNWSDDREIRYFATTQSEAQQIAKNLITERDDLEDEERKYNDKKSASFVVLALNKELFNCIEVFRILLGRSEYFGFSIFSYFDGLPKECSMMINLDEQNRLIDYLHPAVADQAFSLDQFDENTAKCAVHELMKTKLMIDSSAFSLPKMVSFLEMYKVGRIEHLNPIQRWNENNPVKSLAAPVGVGTDGQLFMLDLHEKHQGPHGLIAGMTGSGKSEFIISYILSMAVNYSPDEVAFVLIDYKGGGLADAFENKARGIHLPHVIGTITNLDGPAINRSLMSINSELKRRQEVFKRAKSETNEGTMDIYDYQRLYRNKRVSEPMPHLFIISDEFAELKTQQPDFMNELISAARIGRSLGVHLILATQKPGGVVNDQIRSNTKFRVCLRVQDKADSMEMLRRAEAAELKHTGRFYLQVGYNELFAQGQSAWCGAEYTPQEEIATQKDNKVCFIDNVGQSLLNVEPPVVRQNSGQKQIVAIVEYLSNLAKTHSIADRILWLPPLDDKLDIDALNRSVKTDSYRIAYHSAMLDDPAALKQYPLKLDLTGCGNILLVGEHGSGKTTFLQSMLYQISALYSPEQVQYYVLDYSSRMLKLFAKLPHCGAVLTEENENLLDSFFDIIKERIRQRKKLFSDLEVDGFENAYKLRHLPLILVVIDNLAGMAASSKGQSYLDALQSLLKDGANYGIRYVLSITHLNEAPSRVKQELATRITLHMKDKYEYGEALNTRISYTPPDKKGRGLYVYDGKPLEMQTAMFGAGIEETSRIEVLKGRIATLAEQFVDSQPAVRIKTISETETYEDFCRSFKLRRIPLGYSLADGSAVSLPMKQFSKMSLYFGNKDSIVPVLSNFLYLKDRENATFVFMRRTDGSCFEDLKYRDNIRVFNSDPAGVDIIANLLLAKIGEYYSSYQADCEANGQTPEKIESIPMDYVQTVESFKPVIIVFERYADVTFAAKDSPELVNKLSTVYRLAKQYQLYFIACAYPGDYSLLNGAPVYDRFNPEKLAMLFGGYLKQQRIIDLPYRTDHLDKTDKFNRCIVSYRDGLYPVLMPCGTLQKKELPEEDRPIFEPA